jgi:hypothetical protein
MSFFLDYPRRRGDLLRRSAPKRFQYHGRVSRSSKGRISNRAELFAFRRIERLKRLLQGGNVVEVASPKRRCRKAAAFTSHVSNQVSFLPTRWGNLGFAQDWISQEITAFMGDPGKLYAITCSVLRPIEELSVTNPTLVVVFEPLEIVDRAVLGALLLGGALVSTVLAIMAGIVYHVLRRRSGMRVPFSDA